MSLIERLEAAEAGSDDLDLEMSQTTGVIMTGPRDGVWTTWPPPVTTSLDAALALAERVLPGWTWDVGRSSSGPYRAGVYKPKSSFMTASSERTTPAIALCIAILKAKNEE